MEHHRWLHPHSWQQNEAFPVPPVCDCHQLQPPARHQAGPEIPRAQSARTRHPPRAPRPTRASKPPSFRVMARSSVFCALRRPPEFASRTPKLCSSSGVPQTRSRSPRAAWRASPSAQAWRAPHRVPRALPLGRMRQFVDLFRGETGKAREKSHSRSSTGCFATAIARL